MRPRREAGDPFAAKFGEYKSLTSGLYLNTLQFEAERPGDARFVELIGGALGRKDQYVGLTIGRYNDWRLKAFYNETDHVFTSTYRSLWDGVGTDRLTLRNLLTKPGWTHDEVRTFRGVLSKLARPRRPG